MLTLKQTLLAELLLDTGGCKISCSDAVATAAMSTPCAIRSGCGGVVGSKGEFSGRFEMQLRLGAPVVRLLTAASPNRAAATHFLHVPQARKGNFPFLASSLTSLASVPVPHRC